MTNSAAWASVETLPPTAIGKRVATGSQQYNQIVEFLYDEAALLDQAKFHDWMKLLAADLSYTAPLRITRQGRERDRTVIRTTQHYDEDYSSIKGRVERLDSAFFIHGNDAVGGSIKDRANSRTRGNRRHQADTVETVVIANFCAFDRRDELWSQSADDS